MAADRSPLLPGRLGSPNMELQDDPRADPRMIAALVPLGLGASAPLPVDASSPLEEIREFIGLVETMYEDLFGAPRRVRARSPGSRLESR